MNDGERTQGLAPGPSKPTSASDLAWMAGLFVVAFVASLATMGTSPVLWADTSIENGFLDDCLHYDHCSTIGQGATVGIFHSAGYFHMRALLLWLGSHADTTFRLFLAMGALAVVLTALVAKRLDGRLAAGLASLLMFRLISQGMQFNAITDVAPVPFLGAVFLALAWVAATRPSLMTTALLGLVVAVMAGTYMPTLSCLASAVWISLRQPRRRWTHAVVAVAACVIPAFAIAPGGWIYSADEILGRHPLGHIPPVDPQRFFQVAPLRYVALASGIWVWAWATRRTELRRQLDVPAAVTLPACIALLLGDVTHFVGAQEKYSAHVLAAVSVGIAIPAAALWRHRGPWLEAIPASRRRLAAAVSMALAVFGVGKVVQTSIRDNDNSGFQSIGWLTYHDLAEAAHILQERQWSWADVMRDLKAPDELTMHAAFELARDWPVPKPRERHERAYLLKVSRALVPEPLPSNVVVVDSTRQAMTLLVFTCSWIDWGAFRVCSQESPGAPERCTPSAIPPTADRRLLYWPKVPGMPDEQQRALSEQRVTLHFPLRADAACPDESLWMPSPAEVWQEVSPNTCPGRVVSIDGAPVKAGEATTLALQTDAHPRELAVQWVPASPECVMSYRGWPPFFAEGDPASVDLLTKLLRRHDEGDEPWLLQQLRKWFGNKVPSGHSDGPRSLSLTGGVGSAPRR